MNKTIIAILIGLCLPASVWGQTQSPYMFTPFTPWSATATSQTSPTMVLSAKNQVFNYASGTVNVVGSSLTTVTFSVVGSQDQGTTFNALVIQPCGTTGATTTTATATANGCYWVNLAGIDTVKFQTSGTFTATSVTFTLRANPNVNTVGGAMGATGPAGSYTAGTGIGISGSTLSSNAVYQVSFQPGLLTSVTATKSVYSLIGKAATVDNIVGSAYLFSCIGNPTITLFECGTSATCASPTTIGTVTVTAAGTATNGTISSSAVTAGDYVGWAITSGTCTSLDIAATAQIHSN